MSLDLLSILRQNRLFANFSQQALLQLLPSLQVVRFAEGEQIIARGQAGDSMYLLVEGEVRIPLSERPHRVAQLSAGQFFGEMALLTRTPRSADVFSSQPCLCIRFPQAAVDDLMRQYPEIASLLTAVLGERLLRVGALPRVGKYTLLGELARGGMAVVYEGFHPTLERSVAIKMLHHELSYHPTFGARFRNEAKIIAHLRHPHIVEVFDTEEAYGTFFMIMEKLKGIDLKSAIQSRGKLPPDEVRTIIRQMASALHFAHSHGVIHRDVKASNIMLSPDGDAKLMDFGIAQTDHLPQDVETLGTPFYMAPEQHTGSRLDGRADLYALGVVAFVMLTGLMPFHGDTRQIYEQKKARAGLSARQQVANVPDDLEALIRRATQFHPADRFSDAREMLLLLSQQVPGHYQIEEICTNTITFVYPNSQRKAIASLVVDCLREAHQHTDIIVS